MRSFVTTHPINVRGACRFAFDSSYVKKIARSIQMSPRNHLNEIAELSVSTRAMKNLKRSGPTGHNPTKDGSMRDEPAGDSFTSWSSIEDELMRDGFESDSEFTNVQVAQLLTDELVSRGIDVVIGGSMAVGVIAVPRQTKDIDINISFISKQDLRATLRSIEGVDLIGYEYHSSEVPRSRTLVPTKSIMASFDYKDWPIDAFVCPEPKDELRERIFEKPFIEGGLKFVPPECMCVLKMMCFPRDLRYYKDRADVQMLLETAEHLDKNWVRKELVLRDGENGSRVKEWDELVKRVHERATGTEE